MKLLFSFNNQTKYLSTLGFLGPSYCIYLFNCSQSKVSFVCNNMLIWKKLNLGKHSIYKKQYLQSPEVNGIWKSMAKCWIWPGFIVLGQKLFVWWFFFIFVFYRSILSASTVLSAKNDIVPRKLLARSWTEQQSRGHHHTVIKENKTFLIYKEIQEGSGAKSHMRKGFLIKDMRKCTNI
jgi:hypothetical protein